VPTPRLAAPSPLSLPTLMPLLALMSLLAACATSDVLRPLGEVERL
jgi:hypothetical protein